jgi:hypothetical protein
MPGWEADFVHVYPKPSDPLHQEIPPAPLVASTRLCPAWAPWTGAGWDALIGGELVALAVQVGELPVGAKVKRNLLLQVPGREGPV